MSGRGIAKPEHTLGKGYFDPFSFNGGFDFPQQFRFYPEPFSGGAPTDAIEVKD